MAGGLAIGVGAQTSKDASAASGDLRARFAGTYRYAGRDFRLTDVFGNVVKDILL